MEISGNELVQVSMKICTNDACRCLAILLTYIDSNRVLSSIESKTILCTIEARSCGRPSQEELLRSVALLVTTYNTIGFSLRWPNADA